MLNKDIPNNSDNNVKMKLREEQMEISKSKIETGKVSIRKETSTVEKNITVPIKRQEIVIEKTVFDPKFNDKSHSHTETIRIPIMEENIDIRKRPVNLEKVSVRNHKYKDIKHITETLKKEVPHIRMDENIKIHDTKMDKEY